MKVIVTHARCPDGVASALILSDAYPDAEVRFVAYGDPIEPEPGMIFCDMTPPRERVQEFVAAGATVLDHHETARDIVEAFGERGVYGNGESGAMLAYRHRLQFPIVERKRRRIERFAELVSIRDTWQKNHPMWERACSLSAALMFFPFSRLQLRIGDDPELMEIGDVLVDKRREQAQAAFDNGLDLLFDPKVRLIQGGSEIVSDAAEAKGSEDYALIVAATMHGFTTRVSLRSRGDVHCGEISKRYGGGGHKGAAGFEFLSVNRHPLDVLIERLEDVFA